MHPIDVSALMCGIPLVLSATAYGRFEFLRVRRSRHEPEADVALPHQSHLDLGDQLHVVVAQTPAHFAAVHELVRSRYTWRGYDCPVSHAHNESATRAVTQEVTFLVASGSSAVGTLTLGLDGPAGLLAERTYRDTIRESRGADQRLCELTRLALADGIDSRTVLAALFSLSHAVARALHDATHVFVEVNPRHVTFYCKLLGFVVAARGRFCERVRAQSVLLQLEVAALEQRLNALDFALKLPAGKAA